MTKPIRWGVLGASKFALDFMAPAIHAARGAQLVALASRTPDRVAPFRAFCPDLRVHDSYQALLEDDQVDAVYIPLPNHLHVPWTLRALEAGKHVLCEKPIAMLADEIDALIAKRDATGLLAAEAYMIVHHPQWQRARALIADGAIGELRHVNGLFSYDNSGDPGNIRNHLGSGGGGIPDIGVYTMGATRWVTGQEPRGIAAHVTWENGVDVKAEVTAQFDGFSFFTMLSMRMQLYQDMLFHGTRGVIRLSAPFNAADFGEAVIELRRADNTVITETFPKARQYVNQVESFCDSIRTGAPYPWPLEQAQGTQAMIDRVFAAAKAG